MIRRIAADTLVILAVDVLLILVGSYSTPIHFTRGTYANLPMTYLRCERGSVQR